MGKGKACAGADRGWRLRARSTAHTAAKPASAAPLRTALNIRDVETAPNYMYVAARDET
jgi:hypothetical protein